MSDVRHFADRVLRLKAEQDKLSGDIKEVYAEAKASGFDKTLMGQLVAYLRRREKDPHKVEENSALFDLYLHAYDNGTGLALRAHAHEACNNSWAQHPTDAFVDELQAISDGEPPHDPSTGELIEEPSALLCGGSAVASAEVGTGTGEVPAQLANVRTAAPPARPSTTELPTAVSAREPLVRAPANETAPVSGDAGEMPEPGVYQDASPINSDMPDLPPFLDRRTAA